MSAIGTQSNFHVVAALCSAFGKMRLSLAITTRWRSHRREIFFFTYFTLKLIDE